MRELVKFGNMLGAAGVTAVLLIAFAFQFRYGELPCPLCLLQRVAFVLCGFGFLARLLSWTLIVATLGNALATLALCGPIECPDNPTSYWLKAHL